MTSRPDLLLSLYFGLLIGSHYLTRAFVAGELIASLGARAMPVQALLDTVVSLTIAAIIYSKRHRRGFASRSFGVIWILTLVVIGLRATGIKGSLMSLVVNVTVNQLTSVGIMLGWSMITSLKSNLAGDAVAWYGLGAQIGAIVASSIAILFLSDRAPLVTSAALVFSYVCVGGGAWHCFRRIPIVGAKASDWRGSPGREHHGSRSTPFLVGLGVVVFCSTGVGVLLRWRVYLDVEHASALTAPSMLLAMVFSGSAWIGLFMQIVAVPVVLRSLTPRVGIFLQPLLGVLVTAFAYLNLVPGYLGSIIFSASDNTIGNATRESYLRHAPFLIKFAAKPFFAMLVPTMANVTCNIILLAGLGGSILAALTLTLLALWIFGALALASAYRWLISLPLAETAGSLSELTSDCAEEGSRERVAAALQPGLR